jgi:hypothetical protein
MVHVGADGRDRRPLARRQVVLEQRGRSDHHAVTFSWTLQESQVESCEHQDNSYIHYQPFPEPVSEEQEIHSNYNGYHQRDVKYQSCLSSHFESPVSKYPTFPGWRRVDEDNANFPGCLEPEAPFSKRLARGRRQNVPERLDWLNFPGTWTHSFRRHVALHRPGRRG